MKTMLLAASAALSLGIGSAYADSSGGTIPNTFFTQLPGVTPTAAGAERPGRGDGAGRTACLRHPVGPWHVAVPAS